ncbi:hypothetical protein GCM10008094_28270 [Aidingimonas halophila]|nr:hypothetical protein GCM10008094_28270 [Aidingimonas halophila]
MFRWFNRLLGHQRDITLIAKAAGAMPGEASLSLSLATPTVSTLANRWRDTLARDNKGFRHIRWDDTVTITVTTLDTLIDEQGVPAFCKIDVEGFEDQVLAGLSRPLPALSVEFVAGALDIALTCVNRLESLGGYEYNVVAGEARRFKWHEWQTAQRVQAWLDQGADGLASGDLYARLRNDNTWICPDKENP